MTATVQASATAYNYAAALQSLLDEKTEVTIFVNHARLDNLQIVGFDESTIRVTETKARSGKELQDGIIERKNISTIFWRK